MTCSKLHLSGRRTFWRFAVEEPRVYFKFCASPALIITRIVYACAVP